MQESWFIFQNNSLLLMTELEHSKFPPESVLSLLKPAFLRQHHLGLYNDSECFCAELDPHFALNDLIKPVSLRKAFEELGPLWYVTTAKATAVIGWDTNNQYCGRCGRPTTHKTGSYERYCDNCHFAMYPRISPCMIVMIRKEDKVLMTRSPHFPPGSFGLVAGFVEVGESIESAIHREVREEVGIEIKNVQYFGSQYWPFPDSLMIGFTAEHAAGEIVIDGVEIEVAGWYRYDNLPGRPSTKLSIGMQLLDYYINDQMKKEMVNK